MGGRDRQCNGEEKFRGKRKESDVAWSSQGTGTAARRGQPVSWVV